MPISKWENTDEPFAEITVKVRDLAIELMEGKRAIVLAEIERKEQVFMDLFKHAESLFEERKWIEALKFFEEAGICHDERFQLSLESVSDRISSCKSEIEYVKYFEIALESYQNGEYVKAVEYFEICDNLKTDLVVKKHLEEARKFSLLHSRILDQESLLRNLTDSVSKLQDDQGRIERKVLDVLAQISDNEVISTGHAVSSYSQVLTDRVNEIERFLNELFRLRASIKTEIKRLEEQITSNRNLLQKLIATETKKTSTYFKVELSDLDQRVVSLENLMKERRTN